MPVWPGTTGNLAGTIQATLAIYIPLAIFVQKVLDSRGKKFPLLNASKIKVFARNVLLILSIFLIITVSGYYSEPHEKAREEAFWDSIERNLSEAACQNYVDIYGKGSIHAAEALKCIDSLKSQPMPPDHVTSTKDVSLASASPTPPSMVTPPPETRPASTSETPNRSNPAPSNFSTSTVPVAIHPQIFPSPPPPPPSHKPSPPRHGIFLVSDPITKDQLSEYLKQRGLEISDNVEEAKLILDVDLQITSSYTISGGWIGISNGHMTVSYPGTDSHDVEFPIEKNSTEKFYNGLQTSPLDQASSEARLRALDYITTSLRILTKK